MVAFMDRNHNPWIAAAVGAERRLEMGLLAKIVNALRRMGSFTTRIVKKAGKWVAELVHVPAAPMADAPAVPDMTPTKSDDYSTVRDLAKILAMGDDPTPEQLKGVPEKTFSWLSAMNRRELCRVAVADDKALRGHMRGGEQVRSLVPYEQEAIDDVSAAKSQSRPSERAPTLRDLLEERGVRLAA
jgi:hypothetical protein